jgi:hypothetical protein
MSKSWTFFTETGKKSTLTNDSGNFMKFADELLIGCFLILVLGSEIVYIEIFECLITLFYDRASQRKLMFKLLPTGTVLH